MAVIPKYVLIKVARCSDEIKHPTEIGARLAHLKYDDINVAFASANEYNCSDRCGCVCEVKELIE